MRFIRVVAMTNPIVCIGETTKKHAQSKCFTVGPTSAQTTCFPEPEQGRWQLTASFQVGSHPQARVVVSQAERA